MQRHFYVTPKFSSVDMAAICLLTERELERAIDSSRSLLDLQFLKTCRTTGKPRQFGASDVIKIAALFALSRLGFHRKDVGKICTHVAGRAHAVAMGCVSTNQNEVFYIWVDRAGELQQSLSHTKNVLHVDAPCAVHFKVDQFIRQVFAQMQAVLAARQAGTG